MWSCTGSQALPANLPQCGLLSPRVHRSWQEPAPTRCCPWGYSFLQASTCSSLGSFPQATGGDLLHHGPPWTAGEQPASPWSSSQVAREGSLLRHFGHLLPPSYFTDLGVCRVVSLTSSRSSLSTAVSLLRFFLPFLEYVITEALPPSLIGLGLGLGSSGSVLEPASTGFIKRGRSFSQPCSPPCYQNLAMQTHNRAVRGSA